MTSPSDIVALPYEDRRLLVVMPDLPVQKLRNLASQDSRSTAAVGVGTAAAVAGVTVAAIATGGAALPIAAAVLGVVGAAALRARKTTDRAVETLKVKGTDVRQVSRAEAKELEFPVGHPRSKVVYAGHPAIPFKYYPFSDFHRALFEQKVAEAERLVSALGATSVTVEHVQGWSEGVGINAALGLPTALQTEVSASAGVRRSQGSYIMTKMALHPHGPAVVPQDLVWLSQEPLWQEIVRARLESGLSSFALDVTWADDFGINGSLKTRLSKVGLELGGDFTEYQNTIWRLQGEFAEG